MITKAKIENILDMIDMDLSSYENGQRSGFYFMVYVSHYGMLVPFDWIDSFRDYKEAWQQFMVGQTHIEGGFFYRDVTRFLVSKLRTLESKQ